MESTGVLRGRRRSTGERKSIERRRSRSQSRKSGPKVVQAAREGRDERRRMSDSHRRDSKSKATTRRRERSELRPPLPGRSIIGRSSLPGRLSAPTLTPVAIDVEPGFIDNTAVASSDNSYRIEPMQQVEDEATSITEINWTPGMVADASRGILRGDRDLQLRSLRWIRVVLSLAPKPPAAEVVQAGLIPKLVALLRSKETAELRPEALCALTNIASTECTRAVIQEPDAIPTLKALLSGPERNLREQSAWCLGNIAADSVEMRDLVLRAGVLDSLLQILAPSPQRTMAIVRTGTWALNNLCRGEPSPPLSVVLPILSVIQPIITAATTGDVGTLIDAGWIIYHVTRGGSDRIDAFLFHGLLSLMPDLLLHENPQVVRPVIRAMDNLACSSGAHRGALIATGVLDPLVETLSHESAKVRADALRLISSVAAGSYDQVAAVASTDDLIPSVVTELEEGNALCRREAAWVFLNMCECGFEVNESIIPEMVENGVIAAVCQNLDLEADVESLVVMLSILYNILDDDGCSDDGVRLLNYISLVEEAEGFDRTVRLMNKHDDREVYDKAADIVRCFVDHESLEGKGDEQEGQGSRRVLRRDHLDPDLDSMSDDSLSDDSFHPELSSTTGPITPPQTPRTTERMLPSATVTTDSGTFFGGKSDPPGFGRDIGVAKPPRQPIGAVADLGAKENVGNAGGSGAGVWDISAETPVTGNAGKARFFGNIC